MKTRSRSKRRNKRWAQTRWLGYGMIGAALLAGGFVAPAQDTESGAADDETKANDAEPNSEEAAATAEETETPALTPEEMFEGGADTYNNWVELSFGGLLTKGNRGQAEQQLRLSDGAFGGIEDLHYQRDLDENTKLSLDGRALFDNQDYKLGFDLKRMDKGYLKFNFTQFRTWYGANGGFYPPGRLWSDNAHALDRGEVSVEAGLTLENVPKITFRYTHRYRDGQKDSTSWGPTHPLASPLTRAISPSFYDIDESSDIFELDATHQIKKTKVGLGLRYENGDINNSRKMTLWRDEPIQRKITNREGTSYDAFSVHTFTETWLKQNLFFSTGFLFSDMNSDLTGSRIYGSDFDVGYLPSALSGLGYYDLAGSLEKKEYVLNANLMATPFENLTVVPSVRVQLEDWNGDSFATPTLGNNVLAQAASRSDGDALDFQERLDVRYTGVTNWLFYARGEWTEGDGNLTENGGLGQTLPIHRLSENSRWFQKYSLGARWYPSRTASVDLGGYYKKNTYDYDHLFDSTSNLGASGNRYPAYLMTHQFDTYDGSLRLTLRPIERVSLVSRYEYQFSTIDTTPDVASGLAGMETSTMTSHILAENVNWTPWSRLYLQAGFNYVWSETETPASQVTQAILDAQNNYWTVNLNTGFVVDDRTDLNIGYFYYRSDNYDFNLDATGQVAGLPLGAQATEHGITATVVRRLSDRIRLTVRYGYFRYEDDTSGGYNDFEAHALFSGVQWRF